VEQRHTRRATAAKDMSSWVAKRAVVGAGLRDGIVAPVVRAGEAIPVRRNHEVLYSFVAASIVR
jgi:hypothetical protein